MNFFEEYSMNYIKNRIVLCEDAIKWLESSNEYFNGSIFCGIPDMYDVYDFLGKNEEKNNEIINESNIIEYKTREYKKWFIKTINLIFQRISIGQCVIFTQTDGKVLSNNGNILCWLDKSYLCMSEAEKHGCTLLWHKIAIDSQAEISSYRPCYTHLLCFGKSFTYHSSKFLTPDLIDRGLMTWKKATGLEVCILCVAFLRYIVNTSCIINPFCGHGTILAVSNYFGVPCVGIEVMPKRARKALSRDLRNQINSLPIEKLKILLGSEITQQLFPHLTTNSNIIEKVQENDENIFENDEEGENECEDEAEKENENDGDRKKEEGEENQEIENRIQQLIQQLEEKNESNS